MAETATARTCLTCPSYLETTDAAIFFRKSTGSPMCARFGKVLGRPSATAEVNKQMATHIGSSCSSHGQARPANPAAFNTEVALPDPGAMVRLPDSSPDKTLVRSCAQCVNHVSEEIVEETTGWTAALCAAKGKLILSGRKTQEARDCDFRRAGAATNHFPSLLLPAFNDDTYRVSSPIDDFLAGKEIDDPLDYPTDREPTEDELLVGIKAWRKITDPGGTDNFVMLPIFDPKTFDDEQLDAIPRTGDKEHPELYVDHNGAAYRIAVLWMELDETPAAWGPPGVGKTEVGRYLAWLMQVPFYRFSIKESTEVAELEGSKEFTPERGTWFRDGRFTRAWSQICVAVVDEPNLGRSEVWAYLRPAFDNSKTLVIESDGGRGVNRNAYCFPVLAMNPAWSPLNVGTSPIGAADVSRLMHIKFDYPEESVERSIIESRVRLDGWELDPGRLELLMKVSANLRKLCADGTLMMTWGIRENIKVARALRWFEPITAYRMASADYLEPSQEQVVLDQVRAVTGTKKLPAPKIL